MRVPTRVAERLLLLVDTDDLRHAALEVLGVGPRTFDAGLGADALLHEFDDEPWRHGGVDVAPALLPLGAALGSPPRAGPGEGHLRTLGEAALAGSVAADHERDARARCQPQVRVVADPPERADLDVGHVRRRDGRRRGIRGTRLGSVGRRGAIEIARQRFLSLAGGKHIQRELIVVATLFGESLEQDVLNE